MDAAGGALSQTRCSSTLGPLNTWGLTVSAIVSGARRAHNTLFVAGQDQAEPRGPFSWGRLPLVQAEGWISGKTFDLFVGSHDGYCRLPNAVVHRRCVFALKSGVWLVRDLALGYGEHQLDLFWHLGPELNQVHGERDLFVRDGRGLRFLTVEGCGWTQTVERQSRSPVYGR